MNAQDLISRALAPSAEPWRSRGLLLLRVYVGGSILLAHGLPKLRELWSGHGHFPELVASLGVPAPTVMAWLAMLTQVLGSVALIAGAGTRLAAPAVSSTLAIGMVGVHLHDPFSVVEGGVAYVVVMIALTVVGPGGGSVDGWLWRRRQQRPVGPLSEAAAS